MFLLPHLFPFPPLYFPVCGCFRPIAPPATFFPRLCSFLSPLPSLIIAVPLSCGALLKSPVSNLFAPRSWSSDSRFSFCTPSFRLSSTCLPSLHPLRSCPTPEKFQPRQRVSNFDRSDPIPHPPSQTHSAAVEACRRPPSRSPDPQSCFSPPLCNLSHLTWPLLSTLLLSLIMEAKPRVPLGPCAFLAFHPHGSLTSCWIPEPLVSPLCSMDSFPPEITVRHALAATPPSFLNPSLGPPIVNPHLSSTHRTRPLPIRHPLAPSPIRPVGRICRLSRFDL